MSSAVRRAEGSSFTPYAISSHCSKCNSENITDYSDYIVCFDCNERFKKKGVRSTNEIKVSMRDILYPKKIEIPFLSSSELEIPLVKSLLKRNFPIKSIRSMLKCGVETGHYIVKECGCGVSLIPLTYHCNSSSCPKCAKYRRSRAYRRFLPFFERYPKTKDKFYQMITLSPINFPILEQGLKKIRKDWRNFIRRDYISERIDAGFYVIEIKQVWKGKEIYDNKGNFLYIADKDSWNIHLHAILYGKYIDYSARGKCLECGQNSLKYNKLTKQYHCKKCRSSGVILYSKNKVQEEWVASSGAPVHIYGERVRSPKGAMYYLTKYLTAYKSEFFDEDSFAEYIVCTHKQKLIQYFGFKKGKVEILKNKAPCCCSKCKETMYFMFDLEITKLLLGCLPIPIPNEKSQKVLNV